MYGVCGYSIVSNVSAAWYIRSGIRGATEATSVSLFIQCSSQYSPINYPLYRIKKARRINPLEDSTSAGPSIFAGLKSFQSSTLERKPLTAALMVSPPVRATAPVKTTPFLTHLKSLNESVTKWINEHVNSNPHIDLTPIFKDYKSHLSDIESKV